ncbi:hypothetical protein C8F01DRAFT_1164675 [Mycena amicta]|nr:hypothetical protein C8F01DRAFT_1164675 [Mycena amicta]
MKLIRCILALAATSQAARARFVNVTIDDASPRVIYTSPPSLRCTSETCDAAWTARLFNGTSSTTSAPVIVPFTGTAVYVYLGVEGTVNFNLDGIFQGALTGYNVDAVALAFWEPGLSNSNHVLTIYPSLIGGAEIMQLDYIVYTHEIHSKHIGAIVGGVVGGVVFVALLSKGLFLLVRRRKQRRISMRGIPLGDDWPDKPSIQLSGMLPQKPQQAL